MVGAGVVAQADQFRFSLGMTALSIGWAQGLMPRNRVLGWTMTALVGGALGDRARADHHADVAWRSFAFQRGHGFRWRRVHRHGRLGRDPHPWAGRHRHLDRFPSPGPSSALIAFATGIGLLLFASALGADLISRGVAVVEATGAVPAGFLIGAGGRGSWPTPPGSMGSRSLSRSSCSSG